MVNKRDGSIYYVSNLVTDKVSIIDGDSYRVIKEIEIGSRPRGIIVDENNNVYIASNRNSKVTLIDDLYDANKTWDIPNNGNIKVDSISQKIYVCDTEEVCIYNIMTGERVACLTGFIAADSLELDKDKKRLFVLDIFRNEIKVYDTSNFQLMKVYKEVGRAPSCIIISEDEKYIYISNRGVNKGNHMGNISIVDIENGDISYIDFQRGSVITSLEQRGALLYVANSGLHMIEVIDIVKKKCIGIIKTTLPEVQRLRLSHDKKILIAISGSVDGKYAIDRIATSNNSILDTFTFKESNSIPYDIAIVTQDNFQVDEKSSVFTSLENKWKDQNGTNILAKKVLSTYEEKINFQQISVEISSEDEEVINIEEIIFQKCEIINETKNRKITNEGARYLTLQYDFYIPYYIDYKDGQDEKHGIEGQIKGRQKAILYMPAYFEQDGVEFVINSFAKLTSTPVIINRNLVFDISVLISTKAIVEEIVFIPLCKNCEVCRER